MPSRCVKNKNYAVVNAMSAEKSLLGAIELRDGIFGLEDRDLIVMTDALVARLAAVARARRRSADGSGLAAANERAGLRVPPVHA